MTLNYIPPDRAWHWSLQNWSILNILSISYYDMLLKAHLKFNVIIAHSYGRCDKAASSSALVFCRAYYMSTFSERAAWIIYPQHPPGILVCTMMGSLLPRFPFIEVPILLVSSLLGSLLSLLSRLSPLIQSQIGWISVASTLLAFV